jgi:hypothetical protein
VLSWALLDAILDRSDSKIYDSVMCVWCGGIPNVPSHSIWLAVLEPAKVANFALGIHLIIAKKSPPTPNTFHLGHFHQVDPSDIVARVDYQLLVRALALFLRTYHTKKQRTISKTPTTVATLATMARCTFRPPTSSGLFAAPSSSPASDRGLRRGLESGSTPLSRVATKSVWAVDERPIQ